ncbi:D-alanyl-D-alanine carboxypeptidase family protein [Porticoccus litoralis]|uniref:serine-type D-Ala-D-Ala carboxypeptidase n=1 Tax=Porticoccus litoralis TaxID=434086 RepID=A0AAW8B6Y8_9GAMM|nr:D-alanyl-D-alanine carboxypeptidase family protein [Porticoccus litoralis]MDP1521407.1 D-alanyl-D-alanine carboxypeptidase family protein [Porticoccus litoralis]
MLKKILSIGLLLSLLPAFSQAKILIPAPPELAASAWILMDANTGKVLVEHNADQQLPPASLTKMMTSYIVAAELHNGKIKEQDMVPISVTAWKMGGSKMFVREGTQVPLMDLLRGVVIQSGNDASVALAEYLAGSESAFADVMNQQAQLLGMKNTTFHNATGWPSDGHLTTARDLSLLARALIQDYPEHYDIYAEKYFEYNDIKQPNRNRLLWRDSSVDGLKTGHTEEAGFCLVASAVRNNMRLISVVMGTSSEEARARESQKLLSFGFRYYETGKVYSAGDILKENARVWYGVEDSVNLVVPEDLYLTIPRGSKDQLEAQVVSDEDIEAPLTGGQSLGSLTISFEGEPLLETALVADRSVEEAGIFSRLWDAIKRFFIGIFA